jgi:hypothetical protein
MFKKLWSIILGEPTGYVSEADRVLANLRNRNPQPSESQAAEIANSARIAEQRDHKARN